MLLTGNVSTYPIVCAEATASFSVTSDTINGIKMILSEKYEKDESVALIIKLQMAEKEKLNLTAALHLEKMRSQSQLQLADETDARVSALMQQDVKSLQNKIGGLVETINEVLEELRYAMLEE